MGGFVAPNGSRDQQGISAGIGVFGPIAQPSLRHGNRSSTSRRAPRPRLWAKATAASPSRWRGEASPPPEPGQAAAYLLLSRD